MQKFIVAGLTLIIIGVIGFGIADAARLPESDALPQTVAQAPTAIPTTSEIPTLQATSAPATTNGTPQPVVQAQGIMGDAWQADGTIALLEDFGFTLTTVDGDFYVELGPPTYWQAQGINLAVGDAVSVEGYYNGQQVHARVVTVGDAQLIIRTQDGQPMWSGGASNENGQSNGTGQAQVAPEDWVTLVGVIGTMTNSSVTLNVDDGTVITLQMGRPDFWQSQGITLTDGDPVEVLGFWSGSQFMAGDIRKTATGETIMLRDPNGRQLWGGPGRNGNSGTQGNGNQGNGNHGQGNQNSNGNQG